MPTMRNIHSHSGNYAFLLAGLVFLFLLIPLLHSFPGMVDNAFVTGIGLRIGYCVLMLLGVWSLHREKLIFHIGLVLVGLSVVSAVIDIFYSSISVDLFGQMVVLAFSVISAVMTAKDVFLSATVDRNLLYGATCVYLLLGLIWAILYAVILLFWPSSFNGLDNLQGAVPFDNLLYYSFVTLASLGYGDITPTFPLARMLAYMEVIAGQLYIAVMLAGLVAIYVSDRSSRRR